MTLINEPIRLELKRLRFAKSKTVEIDRSRFLMSKQLALSDFSRFIALIRVGRAV